MQNSGLNMKPTAVVVVLGLLLSGCNALALSAIVGAGQPQPTFVHPPNAKDYASWVDVPKIQLETHSQFALLPREVRPLSDGSEMWIHRFCPKGKKVSLEDCCLYQFVLRDSKVATYRTAGKCGVNCSMRPDAKVQACMNDVILPADGTY